MYILSPPVPAADAPAGSSQLTEHTFAAVAINENAAVVEW